MRALLGLLAFMSLLGSVAARAQRADELIGIWRGAMEYGPIIRGPLIIRKSERAYEATIGNRHAASSVRGDELRFAFGRYGSFRGHTQGSSIAGFWVQPGREAPANGDPGGASQAYATPLRFVRAGRAAWRGEVVRQRDCFALWAWIFKDSGRARTAALRYP